MAIRASILVTTYRKEKVLPNVFHSISRQRTDFEFEVCVLDDCSPIDPKPLFDKYLQVKHKKYVRLLQNIGDFVGRANFKLWPDFTSSYGYNLLQTSPEAEIVVSQNADVIWTQDNMLQRLVDGMKPGEVQFCRVANMDVDPDLYLDWEAGIEKVLSRASSCRSDYQGSRRGGGERSSSDWVGPSNAGQWYPFLVPFYRADLLDSMKLNLLGCCLDTNISGRLKKQGYQMKWLDDMLGVHQYHRPIPKVVVTQESQLRHWSARCPERQEYPE